MWGPQLSGGTGRVAARSFQFRSTRPRSAPQAQWKCPSAEIARSIGRDVPGEGAGVLGSRPPRRAWRIARRFAADHGCVSTLRAALDICDDLDPGRSGALGVVVDVYHCWWDPELQDQIRRAGRERLLGFQVSDWLVPTTHLLNDRGMMGEGIIEIPAIRGWMEAAGYAGYAEVEIFSQRWWEQPIHQVLATCLQSHRCAV